jgi:HEAT repeat protein
MKNVGEILADLIDPDPNVKMAAADELQRMASPNAAEELARYVEDPDPRVRREVAYSLGQIRQDQAIPYLLHFVEKEQDWEIVNEAFYALDEYRDESIKEYLLRDASNNTSLRIYKQFAAKQLRKYDSDAVIDTLIRMVDDDDAVVNIFAVDSLLALNRLSLLSVWQQFRSHVHPYARKIALQAIRRLKR